MFIDILPFDESPLVLKNVIVSTVSQIWELKVSFSRMLGLNFYVKKLKWILINTVLIMSFLEL